jgi:hypothetical protein
MRQHEGKGRRYVDAAQWYIGPPQSRGSSAIRSWTLKASAMRC